MRTGKLLALLLSLALVLCLAGCGGPADEAAGNGEENGGVVSEGEEGEPGADEEEPGNGENGAEPPGPEAAEANISVTSPAGWEPQEGEGLLACYNKDSATFLVTREAIPAEADDDFDQFIEFVKGKFADTFDLIDVEEATALEVAGYEARELCFTAETFGLEMKYRVVYVFRDGYAYALTCGALAGEYAGLEGGFNSFIDSFGFE